MTWIIIVLVLAMIIGPVMYLVPSAKDKRLTALRAAARKVGLTVQITSVAKLDPADQERVSAGGRTRQPRVACTAYQLPITRRLADFKAVMLLKIPAQPTVAIAEVIAGWALDADTPRRVWDAYNADGKGAAALFRAVNRLPDDALAVALDKRFVACYWLENAGPDEQIVESIDAVLAELRTDLYRRFAQSRDA